MPNPDFIPLQGAAEPNPDFIPLEPTGKEKPLQNRPDDTGSGGTLKNIGTTAIKGAAHIPGFAGDLRDLTKYLMARIHAGISGTPVDEVQRRQAENEKRRIAGTPVWARVPQVPSGHDIAAPILERTGEYQPTTEWGRLGAVAGETGLSMIGPGGLSKGLKAAAAGDRGLGLVKPILAGGAKAIPGGAATGLVADAATQVTGDPLAGMLAGAVVPAAAVAAKPIVRPIVEPFVPSMRKPAADRILTQSATDPEAALEALKNRPAKPGETLGESTLDPGLLQAEKATLNTSDHFRAALAERDAQRAEHRKTTIEGVAPPADQMAPVKIFRLHLQDIDEATQQAVERATAQAAEAQAKHIVSRDTSVPPGDPMAVVHGARGHQQDVAAATQETVDRATAAAREAHQGIPALRPHEVTGEALRNILEEADKAKGAAVSKLYEAVDPDGTLSLVTGGPREAATTLHKAFDPTVSEPNTATPIIVKMVNLPEVMPFRKLMELDKTITSKMAEAARSGDRVGHGQLVEMKGAVQSAVDNAIENQAKWRQGAAARGDITPDQTVEARIKQWRAAHYETRDANRNVDARSVGIAGPGSSGSSGSLRARGERDRGFPNTEGDQGISSPEPNFDEGAAARLGAAKETHKERATTYRQSPVASALKTTGFAGQYAMPAGKVPAAAFPRGDVGYHNARAFLRAANDSPEALTALQDTAIARLREAMPDGELTPKALAKWRQDYAPALRAIDERVPGFSDRFTNAARATEAVEIANTARKNALSDAQNGPTAKFAGLTNPSEVGDTLLGMIRAKDGPTQIASALAHMDEAGRAGAKDALGRAVLRSHVGADGKFAADRYRKFISDNRAALEPVFGEPGVNRLLSVSHTATAARNAAEAVEQATLQRKDALANAQKGAAAKFLNLTSPTEVGDTMMGMVKARTGPTQIAVAMAWMDPAAQAGARHALTQSILRDHANADGALSGAKLRNFITDNGPSLEAVYGKSGADVLARLAEDAERYQKAAGLQRTKLGSDTASNLVRLVRERGANALADMSIGFAFANGLFEAVTHGQPGPIMAATALGAAKIAIAKLRANGVNKINDLVELGMTNPDVGAAMMKAALDNKGQIKIETLEALANAVARASAENRTLQEHSRLGRATGGKVQVDHAAMARKLIGLAEKAKKDHGQRTRKMLALPDATIASALRLANEASRG